MTYFPSKCDTFQRHKAKETGPFFLESLGGGNITQEEMKKYVKFMEKKLKLDDENVLPYIQFLQPRVYKVQWHTSNILKVDLKSTLNINIFQEEYR